jgi:hypothetical protein
MGASHEVRAEIQIGVGYLSVSDIKCKYQRKCNVFIVFFNTYNGSLAQNVKFTEKKCIKEDQLHDNKGADKSYKKALPVPRQTTKKSMTAISIQYARIYVC